MIRTVARALLIQQDSVLAVKYSDADGDLYALPGGGQLEREPLRQCLERECREELGVAVDIGAMLFVAEWIDPERAIHQVEFIFRCAAPLIGHITSVVPDSGQVAVEWLPLPAVMDCRLYHLEMRALLPVLARGVDPSPAYLGFSR